MDRSQSLKCLRALQFMKPIFESSIAKEVTDRWKKIQFRYVIECENCIDGGPAEGYCKDCNLFIDNECIEYHRRIRNLQAHKYINFRSERKLTDITPNVYCIANENHTEVLLKELYSIDCKTFYCEICIQNSNQDKSLVKIRSVYLLLDSLFQLLRIMEEILIKRAKNLSGDQQEIFKTISKLIKLAIDQKDFSSFTPPPNVEQTLKIDFAKEFSLKKHDNILDIIDGMKQVINDLTDRVQLTFSPEDERKHGTNIPPRSDQTEAGSSTQYMHTPNINDDQINLTISDQPESFSSADMFGSHRMSNCHQKTPEREISELKQDYTDPNRQLNLDSFENIHPAGHSIND